MHTVVIRCHLKVRREQTSPLREEDPNRTDRNDNSIRETDDQYHSLKACARGTPVHAYSYTSDFPQSLDQFTACSGQESPTYTTRDLLKGSFHLRTTREWVKLEINITKIHWNGKKNDIKINKTLKNQYLF